MAPTRAEARNASRTPAPGTPEPRARKAGRPAKISREMIIETSLRALDGARVEDFTVKAVADALGTTSMAIYRYFPSRDDLLFEVADEVCRRYQPPPECETWQETVTQWLWAIKRHADCYPMMMYVQGQDRRVSRGWARMNLPLVALLQERLGLQGKALSVATYLFGSTAFSMLRVLASNRAQRSRYVLPRISEVTADEREAALLARTQLGSLSEKESLDALFEQYVAGLELLLQPRVRAAAVPPRRARPRGRGTRSASS